MVNTDKNLFLYHAQNIIAVTSGVGSMGKTWLATTLAHALNLQKRSVLLFDANSGLMNVNFQLGLTGTHALDDVVAGTKTFNQAVESINKRRFDVISAASGSEIWDNMPVGRLQIYREYLQTVAQNYDYTVIDLPANEKIMTHLMPPQIKLILVCTGEASNLVSAYNFLQNKELLNNYKSLHIVVNYANSYEEGLRTYNTLRRACEQYIEKTPALLGVIRSDTRVRDAIRNNALLLQRYPNSEAAEDVTLIAQKMMQGDIK